MKRRDMEITPKSAILSDMSGSSPAKRKTAINSVSDEVIDLTTMEIASPKRVKTHINPRDASDDGKCAYTLSSPLKGRESSESCEEVGTRPAKLSSFPARTVGQMASRIEWIALKETSDNVGFRFSRVFSCEFKRSTYYRHRRAWKWLNDNGVLDSAIPSDLWAPLVKAASVALNDEKAEEMPASNSRIKRVKSVEL